MDYEEILRRMHGGGIYFCDDERLAAEQLDCLETLYDYNATRPHEAEKRKELLKKLLAEVGDGCYIEPPLRANWGRHTRVGKNFYANFNLTLVDDDSITIGDNVLIGPNVVLATANHPTHIELRRKAAQYNLPITIGNNVWIGAGAVIVPGVNIGDNCVIGAGSVVTKDIPADSIAFGNPCRVHRKIDARDEKFYGKGRVIDEEILKLL